VKASELIEELRAFIKRSGDLPVTNDDGDPDNMEVCSLEFEE
jgi:hypothetical protein